MDFSDSPSNGSYEQCDSNPYLIPKSRRDSLESFAQGDANLYPSADGAYVNPNPAYDYPYSRNRLAQSTQNASAGQVSVDSYAHCKARPGVQGGRPSRENTDNSQDSDQSYLSKARPGGKVTEYDNNVTKWTEPVLVSKTEDHYDKLQDKKKPPRRLPYLPLVDRNDDPQKKKENGLCSKRRLMVTILTILFVIILVVAGVLTYYFVAQSDSIDCGKYSDFKNGYITYSQGTAPGDVAITQCSIGFKNDGSNHMTCLKNGSWSVPSLCNIVKCGENPNGPINGFAVLPSNHSSNLAYGSAIEVSCNEGFHLFGNSTVTCQANGSWSSPGHCVACGVIVNDKWTNVQSCDVKGEIFLDRSANFELGQTGILTCSVNASLDWNNILIGKHTRNDSTVRKILKINSNGVNETFANSDFSFSTNVETNGDTVSITVKVLFSSILCDDEGVYFCGIQQSSETIKYVTDTVYVATRTEASPELSFPAFTIANRNFTVICSQLVGKTENDQPRSKMFVNVKRQEENSYTQHILQKVSLVGTDCRWQETGQYVFTATAADDGLEVVCVSVGDDVNLASDTQALHVSELTAQIQTSAKSFTINEESSIRCSISNAVGWSSLHIQRQLLTGDMEEILYSVYGSENYSTDNPSLSYVTRNQISDSAVDVEITFNATCHGKMAEQYACVINMGVFNWTEITTVTISHRPGLPELVMSVQVVEGKDTWADRIFYCKGDIGSPAGHIEIDSDIEGDFAKFLGSDNVNYKTIYGFIYKANTNFVDCSFVSKVEFALVNITLAMHRKLLQCVTVPADTTSATTLTSEKKVIEVVPDDYCQNTNSAVIGHPYDCQSLVHCTDRSVNGVTYCSDNLCFSNGFCSGSCESCKRTDIYINDEADAVGISNPVEILCIANGYSAGSEVYIEKDGTNTISTSNGNGTSDIPGYMPSSIAVAFKISSVQCDDAGVYRCSVTNDDSWIDTVQLTVTKEDGSPC